MNPVVWFWLGLVGGFVALSGKGYWDTRTSLTIDGKPLTLKRWLCGEKYVNVHHPRLYGNGKRRGYVSPLYRAWVAKWGAYECCSSSLYPYPQEAATDAQAQWDNGKR